MLRGKQGKPFWSTSLGQIVQFDTIIFGRIFKNYFRQFLWIEKTSHSNSRVSLHEAPTKNVSTMHRDHAYDTPMQMFIIYICSEKFLFLILSLKRNKKKRVFEQIQGNSSMQCRGHSVVTQSPIRRAFGTAYK